MKKIFSRLDIIFFSIGIFTSGVSFGISLCKVRLGISDIYTQLDQFSIFTITFLCSMIGIIHAIRMNEIKEEKEVK